MTLLETYTVQANGRKDAKAGVDSCDDVVKSMLGERPLFDPSQRDHARIEGDLNLDGPIAALETDLQALEDDRAQHPSSLTIDAVLVLAYGAEMLACITLMAALGLDNPAKALIGMMLAASIFWLTAQTAQATGRTRFFTYTVYAALVLAVVGARLADVGETGASPWVESLVLAAATIGPAWLAEWLWRHRAPAAKLGKQIRNVRRRLRALRHRRSNAQKYVDRIGRLQREWDNGATLIRAIYRKEHRRVAGSAPWPARGVVGTN